MQVAHDGMAQLLVDYRKAHNRLRLLRSAAAEVSGWTRTEEVRVEGVTYSGNFVDLPRTTVIKTLDAEISRAQDEYDRLDGLVLKAWKAVMEETNGGKYSGQDDQTR